MENDFCIAKQPYLITKTCFALQIVLHCKITVLYCNTTILLCKMIAALQIDYIALQKTVLHCYITVLLWKIIT